MMEAERYQIEWITDPNDSRAKLTPQETEDAYWRAYQASRRRFAKLRLQWGLDTPEQAAKDEELLSDMYGFKVITPEPPRKQNWWDTLLYWCKIR